VNGKSHGQLIVHPAKEKFRGETNVFELKHEMIFQCRSCMIVENTSSCILSSLPRN
jgi:hypothetical protein